MFEQIKPQNQSGQPVEDIFSPAEQPPNNKPSLMQPLGVPTKPSQPAPGPIQPLTSPREIKIDQEKTPIEFKKRSHFLPILIIVILVITLGILGYFVYNKYVSQPSTNQPDNVNNNNENQNIATPNLNANTPPIITPNQNVDQPVDSDRDGLTDEEEVGLGTNPNEVDSDHDNLYDYEEARVYQTDPLNPDTDGDGYLDGDEVQHGYNPKGSGKLIQLPQ